MHAYSVQHSRIIHTLDTISVEAFATADSDEGDSSITRLSFVIDSGKAGI